MVYVRLCELEDVSVSGLPARLMVLGPAPAMFSPLPSPQFTFTRMLSRLLVWPTVPLSDMWLPASPVHMLHGTLGFTAQSGASVSVGGTPATFTWRMLVACCPIASVAVRWTW